MSKPLEFWIDTFMMECYSAKASAEKYAPGSDIIHMVEHSAYVKLQKELIAVLRERNGQETHISNLNKNLNGAIEAIKYVISESDQMGGGLHSGGYQKLKDALTQIKGDNNA